MEKIIVTRHEALVDLLVDWALVAPGTPVLAHATAEDVRGKHVFGVLPLALAAQATSITEIPLALAPEDRGRELDIHRLRQIAGEPRTWYVNDLDGLRAVQQGLPI